MATPPEEALAAVALFCESRVPPDLRDQVRIECSRRGRTITIAERRPPWKPDLGTEWTNMRIAQLRFDPKSETWTLHCRDSSERWWLYPDVAPSKRVDPLLAEIDADPTGIFWG